jgi:uncharacterized protein YacL (UPF0231 family)
MNAIVLLIGLILGLITALRCSMYHPIYGNGYNEKITKVLCILSIVVSLVGIIIIGLTGD